MSVKKEKFLPHDKNKVNANALNTQIKFIRLRKNKPITNKKKTVTPM